MAEKQCFSAIVATGGERIIGCEPPRCDKCALYRHREKVWKLLPSRPQKGVGLRKERSPMLGHRPCPGLPLKERSAHSRSDTGRRVVVCGFTPPGSAVVFGAERESLKSL